MKNNRAQLKTNNIYGRDYKINSTMILTFVFVERNAVMIAVKLKLTKDVVKSWFIGQK